MALESLTLCSSVRTQTLSGVFIEDESDWNLVDSVEVIDSILGEVSVASMAIGVSDWNPVDLVEVIDAILGGVSVVSMAIGVSAPAHAIKVKIDRHKINIIFILLVHNNIMAIWDYLMTVVLFPISFICSYRHPGSTISPWLYNLVLPDHSS